MVYVSSTMVFSIEKMAWILGTILSKPKTMVEVSESEVFAVGV